MNSKPISILAIESSCDDTAAAVVVGGVVRSNVVATQAIHQQYGGVVPEVASRAHQQHIVPVITQAMLQAEAVFDELDAIAVTNGPGLMGSLIVGLSYAKGVSLALGIPLIHVNHMQAHILAHFAEEPKPTFPFLCLTVSGGHTQIVHVRSVDDMELLGSTLDDAAGEAFDKTGKMLGLDYPAGPLIDQWAQQGRPVFDFPEPQVSGLDYSFSGLKTAVRYFLQDRMKANPSFIQDNLADLCASIQDRIVRILVKKLALAAERTGISQIAIAGGVSANSELRKACRTLAHQHGWELFIPKLAYCTDNAAMVGVAAHFTYQQGKFAEPTIKPQANASVSKKSDYNDSVGKRK